jgi:hypothetical protein
MAFIKHVGRHSGTGQRLSVVFMQLPDEPNNALVVYSDSLPDRYHQDFMEAIESNEGQSAKNLYEVLSRKVFWHGIPMLTTLHKEGHLVKLPTSSIIMTPNSNTNVTLDDIIAAMSGDDSVVQEKAEVEQTTSDNRNQVDVNVEESKKDENKQIAHNLMVQAQLLEEDAKRKREEAYQYDPSLKPSDSKVKITPAKEEGETPKKRGRGRPPKVAEA